MADEEKIPPTEGASEETPEEGKPAETEGEETAEGEDKPEEEAVPAEKEGEDAAPEAEAETEAAEGGEEVKPEEEQEAETEAAVEEEVTATEAEATEAPPAEEEEQAAEEPAQEETAAEEQQEAEQEAEPEPEQEQAQEPEPEQEQQEETEQEQEPEPEPEPEPLELTDEETETFTALFDMYATEDSADGVRKITKSGIKLLFRFMGEIVTDTIVCQWLEESDRNVDGMLNLEEFCSLYKKKRQPEDKRKEELLMSVNTLFPMNGEGDDCISLEKVSSILRHMNTQPGLVSENSVLTEDDINSVIAKIDIDGSNSISRQEFVDFLCGKD